MIKTFVAVCLCMYLNPLLWKDGLPFYSAIAAVLCMQPDVPNSWKVAANRAWGTLIGGLFGMGILLLERSLIPASGQAWDYLIESLCVIPLIYTTLLLKKPAASYITCVVFFSVTISHSGDASPFVFAISRMLDTLLGIFVSLGVNAVHLPRKRRRKLLMVAALEGVLLNDRGAWDNPAKFKLNDLLRRGAAITISTGKTPAALRPLLADMPWRLPVLVMHGAALYDPLAESFLRTAPIPDDAAREVRDLLDRRGVNGFHAYAIEDDLYVYHRELTTDAERAHHRSMRRLPQQHSICADPPAHGDVLHIAVRTDRETADSLHRELLTLQSADRLRVIRSPAPGGTGECLDIYSAETVFAPALADLKAAASADTVAVFGAGVADLPLALLADESYAVADAGADFRRRATYRIGASSRRSAVKAMDRLYYSRRPVLEESAEQEERAPQGKPS